MKRLILALVIGCVFSFLPMAAFEMSSGSWIWSQLKNAANALLYPGYAAALALSLGRFHDLSFSLVICVNVAIYTGIAYLALTLWSKFKAGGGRHRRKVYSR